MVQTCATRADQHSDCGHRLRRTASWFRHPSGVAAGNLGGGTDGTRRGAIEGGKIADPGSFRPEKAGQGVYVQDQTAR